MFAPLCMLLQTLNVLLLILWKHSFLLKIASSIEFFQEIANDISYLVL